VLLDGGGRPLYPAYTVGLGITSLLARDSVMIDPQATLEIGDRKLHAGVNRLASGGV
jgi:hypothetical protein